MKASELINELVQSITKQGDREVLINTSFSPSKSMVTIDKVFQDNGHYVFVTTGNTL